MKKCCVATFVFGKDYQSFIPLYISFLKKEYPQYDIIIYTDRKFDEKYRILLDQLEVSGYRIKQFDALSLGLTANALKNNCILRAVRWLVDDADLLDYEAVYIGDIDILICHEEKPLYEQHMAHANFLQLPYSNCIRTISESNSLRHILGNVKRYGIKNAYQTITFPVKEWNRLTGLHFMKTDCLEKIRQVKGELIRELNSVAENRSSLWTMCNINDESILYELMKEAVGIPAKTDENEVTGVNLVENQNVQSLAFRPHHGLHLALWRNHTFDDTVLLSSTYLKYYRDFYDKYLQEARLRYYIEDNDDFATRLVKNMILYYEKQYRKNGSFYKNQD